MTKTRRTKKPTYSIAELEASIARLEADGSSVMHPEIYLSAMRAELIERKAEEQAA